MKKIFTIAMTLLIASSAFAQEDAKKGPDFNYGARVWLYGVTGQQKDLTYDYSHFRIRPMLSLEMEDIKIVTHLEITQNFGKSISGDDPNYAPPATDKYAVRVKGAYIEAKNAIIQDLSLMGGFNGYKYPLVIDNDFAIFTAGYDFGIAKANLSYIKLNEYSLYEKTVTGDKQSTDAQAYALDVPIKIDKDITVRPGLIYIQGGKKFADNKTAVAGERSTQDLYKTSLVNAALNATGKIDAISFTATGAYLTGTLKRNIDNITTPGTPIDGDKIKTSAYAFDLGVDFKANDMFKVGAFGTYASGDDKKDAKKNNNYFKNMENIFGRPDRCDGSGFGRLFILEAATITQVGGDYEKFFAMEHEQGYISYGINAEAKINKVTLFAQFGMAQTAKKTRIENKKNIGSEIDAKISYALASKTSLFAEFAYILSGDVTLNSFQYYQAKENMYQIAGGITSQI
ncbi:MAG: hypothetical protein FWH53_02880 [Leptospirales bacterium]|nr:hypothetical protein [Leptospirales bacterium]